ncbi:MAG: tRNA preQ1(34) S-adenosylmethionine ribosyltransferase-isomerase QueA [Alphaproteobacteria bacterium]
MRVDAFDFDLPAERIALRPSEPRETARLLAVTPGASSEFADRRIADLPVLLRPGDVLVFNNTRVLPAQLEGSRSREGNTSGAGGGATAARIGVTLHKRLGEAEWLAFARPAKRLTKGDVIAFGEGFSARVAAKTEGGEVALAFDCGGRPFEAALAEYGRMPLPPYIAQRRAADAQDLNDYQTIFAAEPGAVAAPTAGLHFTAALMGALADARVSTAFLTLHVGAGTFLPVKADDTDNHRMHAEWGEIDAATASALNKARADGGRIIAVGTTALRLLESAATEDGTIQPFSGDTAIFITPGYRFRAVDMLFTNFHLPRSTLFMLVSAFSGLETMQRAYSHAIANEYRFYSYGDACLLAPSTEGAR